MDDDKEAKVKDDDDGVTESNDIEADFVEKEQFGSRSVLSQSVMEKLATKYNISDIYFCRAPKEGEFMLDLRSRKIVISIAHLEPGFRFPSRNSLFGSLNPYG